jgi:hypothetical protein
MQAMMLDNDSAADHKNELPAPPNNDNNEYNDSLYIDAHNQVNSDSKLFKNNPFDKQHPSSGILPE